MTAVIVSPGWAGRKPPPSHQRVARKAAPFGARRVFAVGAILAALAVSGCAQPIFQDHYDSDAKASRQDYRDAMGAREPVARDEPAPAIPELQSIISVPELEVPPAARRVTVTVSESTPLKEVLIELAREARVDLELDPAIEGGVIFSARQRPFEEVMRRIADLAGLRFKIEDNVVRIELDTPYHVNYRLNYLNLVRNTTSTISTSSAIVSGGGIASVAGTSAADFWTELETNVLQILTNSAPAGGLLAPPAPPPAGEQTEEAQAPAEAAAAPAEEAAESPSALAEVIGTLVAPTETAATSAAPGATETEAAPDAAPAAAASQAGALGGRPSATDVADLFPLFTVNRHAAIVSVFGTQRQHRLIKAYFDKLRASVAGQVLIEAKVLNVQLNEEFRYGIDWKSIIGGKTLVTGNFAFQALTGAPGDIVRVTLAGDLDEIVQLIEQFGVARALSNPRLTVLHNQTAILKVAEDDVFFNVEIETTQPTVQGGTPVTTINSTVNTVTVGLVMTVQPSIDVEADEITLAIRPTITRVVREENDPAVRIQAQNAGLALDSPVPVIAVQEMDSVVTMRSGNVLVMGGLMQDNTTVNETGFPILSELPWLGYLFKSRQETTEKSELVVLLRATIVRGTSVDPADADLYKRYGQDRRPFSM